MPKSTSVLPNALLNNSNLDFNPVNHGHPSRMSLDHHHNQYSSNVHQLNHSTTNGFSSGQHHQYHSPMHGGHHHQPMNDYRMTNEVNGSNHAQQRYLNSMPNTSSQYSNNQIDSAILALNSYKQLSNQSHMLNPNGNHSNGHNVNPNMRRFISDIVQTQPHQLNTNHYNNQPAYMDSNNNHMYNKNTMINSALTNMSTAQLTNSIGGVINNIITSAMSGQFNLANGAFGALNNNHTPDESKCHVCGDKSTGSHFGGISCESCKAFFRRSVQKNRHEDYKCSYSGECKMNTNTRKICQYCRYNRCLTIGMRPKWVLSDDERHQKYGSRRKNKNKLPSDTVSPADDTSRTMTSSNNTSVPSSRGGDNNLESGDDVSRGSGENLSTTPPSNRSERIGHSVSSNSNESIKRMSNYETENGIKEVTIGSAKITIESNKGSSSSVNDPQSKEDEERRLRTLRDTINQKGINGINMRSSNLNEYERELIDYMSCIFYNARYVNPLDLKGFNETISKLPSKENVEEFRKVSKVFLANFIIVPVQRLITFSKYLPDFRNLAIEDRMALLKGGAMEVHIFTAASLYDTKSQQINNVVSSDRQIPGGDSKGILLQLMRFAWSDELFGRTLKFLGTMKVLDVDEATFVLFVPIILFSPDRKDLTDRAKVAEIQAKYSLLFRKYLKWKYGAKRAREIMTTMLLKLLELRTLHEQHSAILLDTDPEKLDSVPLSIIMNEKDNTYRSTQQSTSTSATSSAMTSTNASSISSPMPMSIPPSVNSHELEPSDIIVEQDEENQSNHKPHHPSHQNQPCLNRPNNQPSHVHTMPKAPGSVTNTSDGLGSTSSSMPASVSSNQYSSYPSISSVSSANPSPYNQDCFSLASDFDNMNAISSVASSI